MITRTQAEALLTLAESLEACERLGMTVEQDYEDAYIQVKGDAHGITSVRGMSVRIIVDRLMPHSET
jgi:hypothetical protein